MANSGVLKQFLATITCNILGAVYGASCAWAGSNYRTLTTEGSPLESGPLTTSEISLVVSIPCLGAIIGTLIYSLAADRFSRRALLVSIAVPEVLSWVFMLLATNVYHLYVARLILGIVGGGALVIIPIYVSEIAEDKVRGTLGSMLILACNFGVLFGFIFSIYLDYYGQIKAHIMLPTSFLIFFTFFPETPEYLTRTDQKLAAEKSLNFFRGIDSKPSAETQKLDEKEKVYEKVENNDDNGLSLSDFCTPAAKKAITIALVLGSLNQLCGAFAMLNYTNKIFEEAGSTLPSSTASVIVACFQLFANFLTMILVDRAGRRLLMTVSAFGCGIGLICMGLYDFHKDALTAYGWIPVASFSAIILMSSIGMLPLTFVILSEIIPKKIKNLVILLALETMWSIAFILVSFYPKITAEYGTYSCMFTFATCCILGGIFYLAKLPETKGKTHEEIMQLMSK